MELKKYQERVMSDVDRFLRELRAQHEKGNVDFGSQAAWKAAKVKGTYTPRETGDGKDLPSVCIKVPTGGGKTLLATQALGSIFRILLRERVGAGGGGGLVLWVVPTSQIYRDTLKALRDHRHGYRMMLSHAVSRRIEVWEKSDIARLSPARLKDTLNVLVVQLASTNRQTKEDLKFFRDSGGNIVDHFPPEGDSEAHRKLKEAVPNLDMIEEDEKAGRFLCATSIGNLVRLCRPPVIMDEGHKGYSDTARKTIEGFNPAFVLELSATPPEKPVKDRPAANIVSRVSGEELLKEEMIKLPLNVKTMGGGGKKKWQDVLTEARDKREHLARLAHEHESLAGPSAHIRPIVLVQVERTGEDQKDKKKIHAEQVRTYLRQNLDVPEAAIKVKSAENDELADVDNLMDPGCPVEWIITKSALQEGWDCPFAYVLVSLDTTQSVKALTQLVGRVLRQPNQRRARESSGGSKDAPEGRFAALNESYAYCLHDKPAEVLKGVKKALEDEGYEGEGASLVRSGDGKEGEGATVRESVWREGIAGMYGRPFEGRIYLPRFCVRADGGKSEKGAYEPLDYFRHLLARVDVETFDYDAVTGWNVAGLMQESKDRLYKVTLGEEAHEAGETAVDNWESDQSVQAWMLANLDAPYLSHKQLRRVVARVYEKLCDSETVFKGRFASCKTEVRSRLAAFVQEQVDKQTETAFGALFDAGRIEFYLQCKECRFEVPPSIQVRAKAGSKLRDLQHDDGKPLGKSLFDFVDENDLTTFERELALVLDRDANVLWWYRNKVGKDQFDVQGYRRDRVFPDFFAQSVTNGREFNTVWVIESKGDHLKGNADTEYKRKLGDFFTRAGKQVTWQQLGAEFKDHKLRFQVLDEHGQGGAEWSDTLRTVLSE